MDGLVLSGASVGLRGHQQSRPGSGSIGVLVESAVDGRVVATHLAIDQEVKAGDVLVELDSGSQSFQLSEEKTQVAGADPQIRSREQEIASEQQALEQDQQSAKDALEEARAHYREAEAAAQFAQTESERLRKMHDAGVVADLDLNRSVADAQQRRAAADSLRYGVVRLEGEQHTRTNERKAHIDQLTSELNKLRGDQATAGVTLQRLKEEVDRRSVRAPVDGKLGEVAPLRIGMVVHEGEKLAAVVPSGKLRVVANFDPPAALGRFGLGSTLACGWKGFPGRNMEVSLPPSPTWPARFAMAASGWSWRSTLIPTLEFLSPMACPVPLKSRSRPSHHRTSCCARQEVLAGPKSNIANLAPGTQP